MAPEPFFLSWQQPLPWGKEKLQGQCGRNLKPREQPGEGGGASWQKALRTPDPSWEPGLGMCWYRGKLGSPVRWGKGAKATSLRTRRMGGTRPTLHSGSLLNTVFLGQCVCSGPSAQVNQSSLLHSQNSRSSNTGYFNSVITKPLRKYSFRDRRGWYTRYLFSGRACFLNPNSVAQTVLCA